MLIQEIHKDAQDPLSHQNKNNFKLNIVILKNVYHAD